MGKSSDLRSNVILERINSFGIVSTDPFPTEMNPKRNVRTKDGPFMTTGDEPVSREVMVEVFE